VRDNSNYGINNFVDNDDETITDLATGLMWQTSDSGDTFNWIESLTIQRIFPLQDMMIGDYQMQKNCEV
jgi:hypothetical protein